MENLSVATSKFQGLEDVMIPLKSRFDLLDKFLEEQVTEFELEIRHLVRYTFEHQGKRLRPILVFCSGWSDSEEFLEEQVRAAAIVELVHLATLVHDDILDNADIRHNCPTLNKKYDPKVAVLLGDAIFSHALYLAAQFKDSSVCRDVSRATRRVCSGEIFQTLNSFGLNYALSDYYRVIDMKTAELFSLSCQLGARFSAYSEGYVGSIARFGNLIGSLYQVYDDINDIFGCEEVVGKTLGTDLATGKLTLPMLLLLDNLGVEDKGEFVSRLKNCSIGYEEVLKLSAKCDLRSKILDELNPRMTEIDELLAPYSDLPNIQHFGFLKSLISSKIEGLLDFSK